MRLEDAKPDMPVVYRPKHGARENGVVTAVGESYVFVRFAGQHPDALGKGCDPRDLEVAR